MAQSFPTSVVHRGSTHGLHPALSHAALQAVTKILQPFLKQLMELVWKVVLELIKGQVEGSIDVSDTGRKIS